MFSFCKDFMASYGFGFCSDSCLFSLFVFLIVKFGCEFLAFSNHDKVFVVSI